MIEDFPVREKEPVVLKRVKLKPRACGPAARDMVPGYWGRCRGKVELELQRLRNRGREGSAQRVRIALRPYQDEVFKDRSSGILILHWSRQIGKSFTLAAWAVDRLLSRPGRLVTVLSNSRENGAEFVAKCAEVCHLNGTEYESVDKSQGVRFQNMRMEVRIRANGKVGRIKVLAANPRTARGFSGDLILDEFAFHEDSAAIWEAAEPILASNPDFLCRMASTGNGRHNLFYRMTCGQARGAGCEADREEGDDNREFTQINAKAGAGPAGSRPLAVATPLRKSVSVPSDSRFRALRELRRMGWV